MSSIKVKSVEASPAKKTITRKSAKKDVVEAGEKVEKVEKVKKVAEKADKVKKVAKKDAEAAPAKVVKAEKTEKVKKPKAESKKAKESVEKTKKVKETAENTDDVKVEKVPKKINVKPTAADSVGLNLSVAKVKTIVSTKCINKEIAIASKEMENARVMHDCDGDGVVAAKDKKFTFSLDDLSEKTIEFLEKCQASITEAACLTHSRKFITALTTKKPADAKRYNEEKRDAVAEFQKSQKTDQLFKQVNFDLIAFNQEFDSEFYSKMSGFESTWKTLKNEELYKHCTNLVNKSKVRFNAESKVFLTAFAEYITKQLVINGTKNCINDGKKIIQLHHALNTISSEFAMFPFVASTNAYKAFLASEAKAAALAAAKKAKVDTESEDEDESEDEAEKEKEVEGEKEHTFKYYVAEVCRDSRMGLSNNDDTVEDPLLSKFNQTSVSKTFKQFCSDVIIELLQTFGRFLKTEVTTRGVKTVNYEIISSLVHNSHIIHNLDSTDTIQFIQEKYNMYNVYIKERHAANAEKLKKGETADAEADSDEETDE